MQANEKKKNQSVSMKLELKLYYFARLKGRTRAGYGAHQTKNEVKFHDDSRHPRPRAIYIYALSTILLCIIK